MSKAEELPQKHSPRWLLYKIQTSKHDGESLMAILEFQKVISNDAIKIRVKAISDEDIDDMFPLKPTDGTEQTTSFNTATIQARGGAKSFKNKLIKQ